MSTITKPSVRPQPSKPQLKPPIPEQRANDGSTHEDEIRPLAYRKWQESGCPISDGVEFWLAAETEILRRKKPR
jgi:hypothetical protein